MRSKSGYYDNQITDQEIGDRYDCWQIILASMSRETTVIPRDFDIDSVELNLPNQRVVNMDVARTRVNTLPPQSSRALQRLLTLYCKNNHILYKQGMNEIMAPFFLFSKCPHATYESIYNIFEVFFSKYLLNLYFDQDFNSLQFLFRMVSIIMEYHEPGLARFLSTNDLQPELYSTPWFMTLFANKLSIRMIYSFWEIYLLEDDQFLIFYFIVGLLIYKKNEILQTKSGELPQFLAELIFETPQQLLDVYRLALLVRKSTPRSLILFCFQNGIFEKWENFDRVKKIFEHIIKVNLFLVLPLELVVHFYGVRDSKCPLQNPQCSSRAKMCHFCKFEQPLEFNPLKQSKESQFLSNTLRLSNDVRLMEGVINFVVIDIRVKKPKILIDCQIVDIADPLQKIEQNFISKYLEWRGRYHFVFLFSHFKFDEIAKCNTQEWEFCKRFIHILYSLGFLHLGILEGGFDGLEAGIRMEVDRSKDTEPECPKLTNFAGYYIPIQGKEIEYWARHCLLKQIELPALPSTLVYLEKLCVDPHSRFFVGSRETMLVTRHLLILFNNSQTLKEIVVYLGNTKSAMEYLIGVTRYCEKSSITIKSILLPRYLNKVVVRAQPAHLALYFLLPTINKDHHLSQYLMALNQSDPLRYLSSLSNDDFYRLYQNNPNGPSRNKVGFESGDIKELTECADFIKKNFEMLQLKYQLFNSRS